MTKNVKETNTKLNHPLVIYLFFLPSYHNCPAPNTKVICINFNFREGNTIIIKIIRISFCLRKQTKEEGGRGRHHRRYLAEKKTTATAVSCASLDINRLFSTIRLGAMAQTRLLLGKRSNKGYTAGLDQRSCPIGNRRRGRADQAEKVS